MEGRAVVSRPRGLAARKAFKADMEGSAWMARKYIVGEIVRRWWTDARLLSAGFENRVYMVPAGQCNISESRSKVRQAWS